MFGYFVIVTCVHKNEFGIKVVYTQVHNSFWSMISGCLMKWNVHHACMLSGMCDHYWKVVLGVGCTLLTRLHVTLGWF